MITWLDLLRNCWNVTTKCASRSTFNRNEALRNVSDTRYAVRCGYGYSLIDWKLS